ncbi:MAG: hypothetical protein M1364_01150 [Candidatus Marsarchaeota archaeon]|nr:hypothetical protein [Candidatus Marsarchaeota archaeon]
MNLRARIKHKNMNGNIDNMHSEGAYAKRHSKIRLQLGLSKELCNPHLKEMVKAYKDEHRKISEVDDITW